MIRLCITLLACCIVAGCGSGKPPVPRTQDAAVMFAPVSMRIHPIFTQPKDWTGDEKDDGIEALLEFTDQFGDPTKASGTVIFELYAYQPYSPDPRGERLVNPWIGSLGTLPEQQARWNRTSRTYTFQLEYPQIAKQRNYVLMATFDTGNTRFFDRIILENPAKEPAKEPERVPIPAPTTAPTTAPATNPSFGRADEP